MPKGLAQSTLVFTQRRRIEGDLPLFRDAQWPPGFDGLDATGALVLTSGGYDGDEEPSSQMTVTEIASELGFVLEFRVRGCELPKVGISGIP
jgi:hypothetical protein